MKKPTPPAWLGLLLEKFLDSRTLEASLGDIDEKFHGRISGGMSLRKAKLLYVVEGLGFIRMTGSKKESKNQSYLFIHTILFFARLVKRDKGYYGVSLIGLTISLSSFLFSMMFINDELSYDQFHVNADRIHRVSTHLKLSGIDYDMATSQFPAAVAIKQEIPEVKEAVRFYRQTSLIESGDLRFEEEVFFADDQFFDVFTFRWLMGEPGTVLHDPANMVITETTAKKYFGPVNPIGKLLKMEGQQLVVKGVIADIPEQSHLHFDAIIPLAFKLNQWKARSGIEGRENKWFWVGAYTYLLLNDAADAKVVESKLPLVVNKYFPERYKEAGRMELQPMTEIHLHSQLEAELMPPGNILYVRLFSIVALVIMVVSSINLINLSYFKLSARVREVGIRKFLGQSGSRVVAQLSLESIFVGVIAFLLSLLVCQLLLGQFNLLVEKNIFLWSIPNQFVIAGTFALIILISLISVLPPAWQYARRPSNYLLLQKNKHRGSDFRNVMIGLQVSFSFVLLVFSFTVSSQISFFRNKDLGFDKSNVIVLPMNPDIRKHFDVFRTELKNSGVVTEVTGSVSPGSAISGWRFVPEGGSYEKPVMIPFESCDYDFLSMMKIRIVAGENFSKDIRYDSLSLPPLMISRRAAVELGWQDDAVGKTLEVFAPGREEIMMKGKVIGIFEDYHFESLHRPVKPLVLSVETFFPSVLLRMVNVDDASLAYVERHWKNLTNKPFDYEILEKKLDQLYTNERNLGNVVVFFTFIALYLTCYGLFAMSSLVFSSKLKEVAIRKVFGASQGHIIRQFYTRYAAFNFAAIVAGIPAGIYLGNLWLEGFQYRINLTYDLFAKAAICILAAGLISVSYYLGRIAYCNPTSHLRQN